MPTTAAVDFDTFSFKRVWWLIRHDILLLPPRGYLWLVGIMVMLIIASFTYTDNDDNYPSFILVYILFGIHFYLLKFLEENQPLIRKSQRLIPARPMEKFTTNVFYLAVLVPLCLHFCFFVVSYIFRAVFLWQDSSWKIIFTMDKIEVLILLGYWFMTLSTINYRITIKSLSSILKILPLLISATVLLIAIDILIEEISIYIRLGITLLLLLFIALGITEQPYYTILKALLFLALLTVLQLIISTLLGEEPTNLDLYIMSFFLFMIIAWIITFVLVQIHYARQ